MRKQKGKKEKKRKLETMLLLLLPSSNRKIFFVSMFELENSIFTKNMNDPREKSTRTKKNA
jgi:hypothetical protein